MGAAPITELAMSHTSVAEGHAIVMRCQLHSVVVHLTGATTNRTGADRALTQVGTVLTTLLQGGTFFSLPIQPCGHCCPPRMWLHDVPLLRFL